MIKLSRLLLRTIQPLPLHLFLSVFGFSCWPFRALAEWPVCRNRITYLNFVFFHATSFVCTALSFFIKYFILISNFAFPPTIPRAASQLVFQVVTWIVYSEIRDPQAVDHCTLLLFFLFHICNSHILSLAHVCVFYMYFYFISIFLSRGQFSGKL